MRGKVKSFIYRQLCRFHLWCFKILARRAVAIQRFARSIAIVRIRSHFNLSLTGDDEKLDKELLDIVCGFFDQNAKSPDVISKSEYAQWLENDVVSKNDRKMYLRVSHWLAEQTGDEEKASLIGSIHQSRYGQPLEPVEHNDIGRMHSVFRKRFIVESKTFRKSKVRLYDLRLEKITPLIPWFSVVFILAGYTYTYSVYSHFGVDVSKFFSMSDYLAVSIEEITSCLGIFAGLMIAALREYRDERTRTKHEIQNPSTKSVLNYGIRYMSCFGYLYMMYVGIIPLGLAEFLGPVVIIYVAQLPLAFIVVRYFENPKHLLLVSLALIGFLSGIRISAEEHIKSVEQRQSGITFRIETGTREFTQERFSFIGGNSRYIFLHSEEGNVEIVPIESTERIKISTDKKSSASENGNKQ